MQIHHNPERADHYAPRDDHSARAFDALVDTARQTFNAITIDGGDVYVDDTLVALPERKPVTMRTARARKVIGVAIADDEMAEVFKRLGLGSVLGLVLGGALTALSWRLAFLVNVPIGLIIIWIAVTRIAETQHERLKLDITGALLATLGCSAAVLVFTQGPPRGWIDPWVIGAAVAAVICLLAFWSIERRADNPLVPPTVFDNRNRLASFAAYFLAGGVMLTLSVMIGLLVQDVLGYSPLRAGLCFMPFALAFVIGNVLANLNREGKTLIFTTHIEPTGALTPTFLPGPTPARFSGE